MGKKSKSKKKSSAAPPVSGAKKTSDEGKTVIQFPPAGQRGIELRFEVGTKVLCQLSPGEWRPGRITQHWYRKQHWPDDAYAPYIIKLNSGGVTYMYALADLNAFVKLKDPLPHMIYEEQADAASQNGDHRRAASLYLESFRSAPKAWIACRFNAFKSYYFSLRDAAKTDPNLQVTKQDIKDMKYVLNSEQEPILVRVKAAMMLSIVHGGDIFKNCDRATACDYLRIGLSLYDLATPEEKQTVILYSGEMKRIEEVLKELREAMSNLLAELNGVFSGSFEMASRYPLESRVFYPVGSKCDCCGKTLEELGVDFLGCCRRCKKAYYCSVECQKSSGMLVTKKLAASRAKSKKEMSCRLEDL